MWFSLVVVVILRTSGDRGFLGTHKWAVWHKVGVSKGYGGPMKFLTQNRGPGFLSLRTTDLIIQLSI